MRLSALLLIALMAFAALAQDTSPPTLTLTVAGESCSLTVLADGADADPTADATADATPDSTAAPDATTTPAAVPTADPTADATPDATPDAPSPDALPMLTLADDCVEVLPLLVVPRNGTLWVAVSMEDEEAWLQFQTLPDDPYAPRLDRRGRFIGCAHPEQGPQECRVTVEIDGVTYLVVIPVVVGAAFSAPAPTAPPASIATPTESAPPPPPPNATPDS